MITLDTALKTLEVSLGGAVALTELPIAAMWTDWNTSAGTQTLASSETTTTGVSAVTAVAAPALNVSRVVNLLSVYNADTQPATVLVKYNNNGTVYQLVKQYLLAGQSLLYTRDGGWQGPGPFAANLTQLAGTAVAASSGTTDGGTQRVVLATDQPQLSNKLLVTPDSVALPAHQSVNLDQWGGVAPTAAYALADGASLPTAPVVGSVPLLYNGSQLLIGRSNVPTTLLASGVRTSNTNCPTMYNFTAKGAKIYVNVTAGTTLSIYLVINVNDNLGVGYTLWQSAAAITGVGKYVYELYPGLGTAVQQQVVERQPILLDYIWTLVMVHGNGNSATYSVCCVQYN